MKKFIIPICILLIFSFAACNNSNVNSNSADIASEVIINLPQDDSVNGYRNAVVSGNTSSSGMPDIISGDEVSAGEIGAGNNASSEKYCANKSSKVFHSSECGSVASIKEDNKYYADRKVLINEGYKPCGRCNP